MEQVTSVNPRPRVRTRWQPAAAKPSLPAPGARRGSDQGNEVAPDRPLDRVNGSETPPCRICGAPPPPRTSRRGPPPSTHDPCRRWNGYWTSAQTALEEIEWPEGEAGAGARSEVRRQLLEAANRTGAGLWRRDEVGRFKGGSDDE